MLGSQVGVESGVASAMAQPQLVLGVVCLRDGVVVAEASLSDEHDFSHQRASGPCASAAAGCDCCNRGGTYTDTLTRTHRHLHRHTHSHIFKYLLQMRYLVAIRQVLAKQHLFSKHRQPHAPRREGTNSHRFQGAMDSFPGCKRPCKIPLIHAFVEQRPTATPQHVVLPQGGPCKIPFTHARVYHTYHVGADFRRRAADMDPPCNASWLAELAWSNCIRRKT